MKKGLLVAGIALVALVVIYFTIDDKKNTDRFAEEVMVENEEREEEHNESGIPILMVSNAKGNQGDEIKVAVKLVNNPGILGISTTLSYDEKVLELIEIEEGVAFEDVLTMTRSKDMSSGCVVLWDGESVSEEQIQDGEILNLHFKILKTAPAGKSPVTIVIGDDAAYDNDLNSVNINVDNGFVTVVE